jgi:hypothetical protein
MLDLDTWSLTRPEATPVRTIEAAQIQSGYRDQYFYNEGARITFWAPVTGTPTGNSNFPRSELRETFKDGTARNWRYAEGDHALRATLAVGQVPSNGTVVIGQMHSKDNISPYIKLVYRQSNGVGYINVSLRHKPTDTASPTVMTYKGMPLNYPFSYAIEVSRTGWVKVDIAGMTYQGQIDPSWKDHRFYYKAGMYNLDNVGTSSEGGRVSFEALGITHTP